MSHELTHLVESARMSGCGLACGLTLTLLACTQPNTAAPPVAPAAAAADAPDWSAALTFDTRYDAPRTALVLDVHVAPGFHAYTAGETVGKPMTLELSPDSELSAAGPTAYPKGVTKVLEVGRSTIVEGTAELVAPLQAPSAGKTAKGTFRYQVCTDTACDRPRSAEVKLTVP